MRIHHVALRVADCERAAAFYTGILGLTETRRTVGTGQIHSVWLAADQVVVMLERSLRGAGNDAGSAHVLVFEIDDLASWEARLTGAGVAIVDRTAYTLYLNDPDGHRVGLTVFGKAPA